MPNRVTAVARSSLSSRSAAAAASCREGWFMAASPAADEKVAMGMLRFVPIEAESPLPSTSGRIVDGQYRIDNGAASPWASTASRSTLRRATGRKKPTSSVGQDDRRNRHRRAKVYAGASRRWWSK